MKNIFIIILGFISLFSSQVNAQTTKITISGTLEDEITKTPIPFVNVVLKNNRDSSFVSGAISNENGIFTLKNISPNDYILSISLVGYKQKEMPLFVGSTSKFLNVGKLFLTENISELGEVSVTAKRDEITSKMDKKTYSVENNISQSGGSVLQAVENLPGITVQDNKVQLRGSNKVIILINGKQSALTGYGNQSGLDNIPASSIERIEIINNPSSKYDANGNAGIINIILKKEVENGLNGKVSLTTGVGSLWIRKENLPTIRSQYQFTPKINPSVSLNYRKNKINTFLQVDNLYTQKLNKNEFITRTYDDGTVINQQIKRNRNTNYLTSKIGLDWFINENNQFTVSGMFGREKIIDKGDEPFFNQNNTERLRLWQFLEEELKTTITANTFFKHKFKEPGRLLNTGINYTFHRENEQYFFDNILPTYRGKDAFKLLSDEHVIDFNLDYTHPLKYGKLETGVKLRYRDIPTDMQFFPSLISPLDTNAGGKARYNEVIPALYGNYIFENKKWEGDIGLRVEYVQLNYFVNPNHNTYKSDGYNYLQPFPNLRLGYKINDKNKLIAFYNRRVDRPTEGQVRIFPKYNDAEIIKVGNPSLRPQYTNLVELGYRHKLKKGYWVSSLYSRFTNNTITRISTKTDSSNLIYAVYQNAGNSNTTGLESVLTQDISKFFSYNLSVNAYYKQIDAFTTESKYPKPITYKSAKETIFSGNLKLNATFHFKKDLDFQITTIYLAPDIIPQGKTGSRFTLNMGLKKAIQKGKGSLFFNASDLFNTMVIRKEIKGNGFSYTSANYYETQVLRFGYSYKF